MATFQEITKKINDITDNGNNTAAEVRSVLTDLLNFSNSGFEIAPLSVIVSETKMYSYSFKGIKEQCCNLFLFLYNKPQEKSVSNNILDKLLFIEISQENFSILSSFIPVAEPDNSMPLMFNVPTLNNIIRTLSIILYKKDNKLYVLIVNNLDYSEIISTTVPLNFKKIILPSTDNIINRDFTTEFKTTFRSKDFLNINLDNIK